MINPPKLCNDDHPPDRSCRDCFRIWAAHQVVEDALKRVSKIAHVHSVYATVEHLLKTANTALGQRKVRVLEDLCPSTKPDSKPAS